MPPTLTLGCGECGFRNRPIPEWIDLAVSLGFRHLEFGIGGGWPGRLPEEPIPADLPASGAPPPPTPSPPPIAAWRMTSPVPTRPSTGRRSARPLRSFPPPPTAAR